MIPGTPSTRYEYTDVVCHMQPATCTRETQLDVRVLYGVHKHSTIVPGTRYKYSRALVLVVCNQGVKRWTGTTAVISNDSGFRTRDDSHDSSLS